MSKHTPTPWILFGQRDGDRWDAHAILPAGRPGDVAEFKAPPKEADAQFIVQAVNAHDALVEALRQIATDAEAVETRLEPATTGESIDEVTASRAYDDANDIKCRARAALKLAGVET